MIHAVTFIHLNPLQDLHNSCFLLLVKYIFFIFLSLYFFQVVLFFFLLHSFLSPTFNIFFVFSQGAFLFIVLFLSFSIAFSPHVVLLFLSVLCVQTLSELRKAFRALNPNSLYQECKCVCDCVTRQGLATSAGLNNKVARCSAAGVRMSLGQLTELSLALAGHNITTL